jgi:serine/threonine protein kinase
MRQLRPRAPELRPRVPEPVVESPALRAVEPTSPPPSPTPSASPSVGRRIGKYTIRAPLSEGGMARVYIAQRDGADQICVLKQLLLDLESNEVAVARFRREAHVAAFLRHPNIARVIDAGEDGETFYIAMDLINGKDLESMAHELLRSHRLLPYPITLTAMVGILDGLAYAHAARDPDGQWMQVVHRDLSPRNMMLTFDGTAKVIDFGMAKGRFDSFKTLPGWCWARCASCRPSRRWRSRSTRAATSTRWRWCCTSSSAARCWCARATP